ncbi:MAG: polyprenyl synthetase family protein [Candidatus Gastranaerophilales bacterium]|nr:polyprenyl synthetase family protein [Candidatus Gastranaerophilales bacterium]
MNRIIFPIKKELEIFEKDLKEIILLQDNFLMSDLEKFIFNNPKRLRPILIFLSAKILKIDNALTNKIAIITELIHSASLIHDDIIDEEALRRNHPTFFKKYGSKLAVLEGDLLLALALEELGKTSLDITKIFASKIKKTIQGEINQNENLNKITNIETYFKKTNAKTANLFIAGIEALFTLGKKNENLLSFIENFALGFQIKNDIDDFKSNKSDIKNGNYTLPMIYSSIEKSIEKVEEIKNIALEELNKIENSIYKDSLIELANYTLRS